MYSMTPNSDLFQSIFETSQEGIMAIDKEGIIVTANPACEKLFGYTIKELIGQNIDLLIPENLKNPYKSFIRSTNPIPIKERDLWGTKKDGSIFSLNLTLNPTQINGKPGTIAFLWDATRQNKVVRTIRKKNFQLIESNRKFDALINNQKCIFYRCKNNSIDKVEFISKGCLETTGYSAIDFINQNVEYGQIILPEDRDRVYEALKNALDQKSAFSIEYRIEHRDGTIKYVWEKGEGIFNGQNGSTVLEGFITDISPQKEIEMELRHSQSKIKALLKAIPDLMFLQDREGIYLDWYANLPKKWFGEPEAFMGRNMKSVLPTQLYQKIKTSHQKVLESGKMELAEFTLSGKNGPEHYEARVVPMNADTLLTIVRDVSDKREMDELLKIQNNALTSASNSILILDAQRPHSPIIFCNPAFEKMTGYSLKEILGNNGDFLLNDDFDQREVKAIQNAILTGTPCNAVVRHYRKDGSLFWNDITVTPVYNDEKKLTHFIQVQTEVTNKVREEFLKDSIRKILELIVQNNPLKDIGKAIIETLETHFKDCVASFLLYDPEHKKLRELVSPKMAIGSCLVEGISVNPDSGPSAAAAFHRKKVIIPDIQKDVRWKDFKEMAISHGIRSCWAFPILSSSQEVLGTMGLYGFEIRKPSSEEKKILLDLTYLASIAIENYRKTIIIEDSRRELEKHAKKLEQTIKERTQEVMSTIQKLVETNLNLEEQIRITKLAESDAISSKSIASEIAKNFPNGFVVVMDKATRIVFAEGDALSKLGLKQTFHEGMTLDDITFFSKKRKLLIKKNIRQTLNGKPVSFEASFKGRYFTVNTAALTDQNNRITDVLHVFNDITIQKEIEFAVQNSLKKEQELNELKSRFISMASHEFRTPLSAILTSAILIGKQNENGQEQIRTKYLAQIERNVNNLTVILNDFLSLSKLDEGKVIPSPELFDLIGFSRSLVTEMTFAGLKNRQVINFSSPQKELLVYLDEKLLAHIVNNLLSNASKYSPEGSPIDFHIFQQEEKVILQISDQGIGIPKEEESHLFDRFFRAKNATNIEGTGLGLNIVKQYADLMKGTIEFKSELNKGSTFILKFPKPSQ